MPPPFGISLYATEDLKNMLRDLGCPSDPAWSRTTLVNLLYKLAPPGVQGDLPLTKRMTRQQLIDLAKQRGVPLEESAGKQQIRDAIRKDHNAKQEALHPDERFVGFGKHAFKTWQQVLDVKVFCDDILAKHNEHPGEGNTSLDRLAKFLENHSGAASKDDEKGLRRLSAEIPEEDSCVADRFDVSSIGSGVAATCGSTESQHAVGDSWDSDTQEDDMTRPQGHAAAASSSASAPPYKTRWADVCGMEEMPDNMADWQAVFAQMNKDELAMVQEALQTATRTSRR